MLVGLARKQRQSLTVHGKSFDAGLLIRNGLPCEPSKRLQLRIPHPIQLPQPDSGIVYVGTLAQLYIELSSLHVGCALSPV